MNESTLPRREGGAAIAKLERGLGLLMSVGVGMSLLLLVSGVMIALMQHPGLTGDRAQAEKITRGAAMHTSLTEVVRGALRGDGESLVALGLLLLIATPAMRVLVTMAVFSRRRDVAFAIMSGFVLVLMGLSLFAGGG